MDDNADLLRWESYLGSLNQQSLRCLKTQFLSPAVGELKGSRLARSLYNLLQREEFLEQARADLSRAERCILVVLADRPCSFLQLRSCLPLNIQPVPLGMQLARLRSRLLLGRLKGCYFVPEPLRSRLNLSVADAFTCSATASTPPPRPPWLEEGLLLALASYYLQNEGRKDEIFPCLCSLSAATWQQLPQLLQRLALLSRGENGYRPQLPSPSLLALSPEQRLWLYWALMVGIDEALLYRLLWPLRHLPPFERHSWECWLRRFEDLGTGENPLLTEKLVELELLLETGNYLQVNPLLAEVLSRDRQEIEPLRLPATLEFHCRGADLRLELACLTFCCRIHHFDTVAIFQLQAPLFQRVCANLGSGEQLSRWSKLAEQAAVEIDISTRQQLKLFYHDGQRQRFFAAAPVLVCEPPFRDILMQLSELTPYFLTAPKDGIFVFHPLRPGWREIVSQVGIQLQDAMPVQAPAFRPLASQEWPPTLQTLGYRQQPQVEQTELPPSLTVLRSVSGLDYHGKRQLLDSVISNGEYLVEVHRLGEGSESERLLLLPLSLEKVDGSYVLKACNVANDTTLTLDIGRILTLNECSYAPLSEPLHNLYRLTKK